MNELSETQVQALIAAAVEARAAAYAPYSNYHVGAALLGESGTIYRGCNVENASYPVSLCAERNALGQAVVHGERKIVAAVVLTDTTPPPSPCGMCRQALAEFGSDATVILATPDGEVTRYSLRELLPHRFDKTFLEREP